MEHKNERSMWVSWRLFLWSQCSLAGCLRFFPHINEMYSEVEKQNTDTISCLPLHAVQAYKNHCNGFGPPDAFLKSFSLLNEVPTPAVHWEKSWSWQFRMATLSHLHKNDLWKFIDSTCFPQESLSLHPGELFLAIIISIVYCLHLNHGHGWMCSPAKWQKGTNRDFRAWFWETSLEG